MFSDEPPGSFTDEFRSQKILPIGIAAGGARRDRTDDLLLAKQALSQLSYGPCRSGELNRSALASEGLVGLGRFELPTSRLSSARSNQLSYRPNYIPKHQSECTRFAPRPKPLRGKRMLQRRMDCVGSSEKKEKRRRRSPANRPANPETDRP
jgi:hypothetical protein